MKNILVTGGEGQLAMCLKDVAPTLEDFHFIYVDVDRLDITKASEVNKFFLDHDISYCINCAAYTAVDQAETNREVAHKVNVIGVENLAIACKLNGTTLIHISTDFVFDGRQTTLYTEEAQPNPLSVYGSTKLEGELAIAEVLKEHVIVRTSWLYSEHGSNFLKTMLRLGKERDSLGVVTDQIGTPTYAGDLAQVILQFIKARQPAYGIYHYSNEGIASWYDFAKAIFEEGGLEVSLSPIKTEAYPTPAERPKFSVMDKTKIKTTLGISIPYWRDSLRTGLKHTIQLR